MIDPTPMLKEIDFLLLRISNLNTENVKLQSTITAQEDVIKRLREDAERLNNLSECYIGQHHMPGEICNRCGYQLTCPITLHTQLMNELGEK